MPIARQLTLPPDSFTMCSKWSFDTGTTDSLESREEQKPFELGVLLHGFERDGGRASRAERRRPPTSLRPWPSDPGTPRARRGHADHFFADARMVEEGEVALLHRPQVVARLEVAHAVPAGLAVGDELVVRVGVRFALDQPVLSRHATFSSSGLGGEHHDACRTRPAKGLLLGLGQVRAGVEQREGDVLVEPLRQNGVGASNRPTSGCSASRALRRWCRPPWVPRRRKAHRRADAGRECREVRARAAAPCPRRRGPEDRGDGVVEDGHQRLGTLRAWGR